MPHAARNDVFHRPKETRFVGRALRPAEFDSMRQAERSPYKTIRNHFNALYASTPLATFPYVSVSRKFLPP